MSKIESRYQQIRQKVDELTDFPDAEQAKSRALFDLIDLKNGVVRPRRFDVWTCLAGLPLPHELTQSFQEIARQVENLLPPQVIFYQVIPANYHWEVFIIKRPTEQIYLENLTKAVDILREIFSKESPLHIAYRGFLVTPDGTLLVQGTGEFDRLRQKLREAIPFASSKQSQLGHISLGRILDPLGEEKFCQLKQMVRDSQNEVYGEWAITEVKYIYERQWYMEDKEVIANLPLNCG